MAIARVNRPAVVVYGGTIRAGKQSWCKAVETNSETIEMTMPW